MRSFKSFVTGFLVASLFFATTYIYANDIVKSIDVVFNSINIFINGNKGGEAGESYQLRNGKTVPFSITYKGTTYLPIRKVTELLDKDVDWDQETRTVHINDKEDTNSIDEVTAEKSAEETASNADDIKPTIVEVKALTEASVEVTYSEEVDKISAEDVTNYQMRQKVGSDNKLQIIKAELNSDKTKVVLTTKVLKNITLYNLEVSDVVDLNGNVINDASKTFVSMKSDGLNGISFITEGEFDVVLIECIDKNSINVIVNKELDKEMVEDPNNYIFTEEYGSQTRLVISNAELDSTGTIVKLTTDTQETSLYKAEIMQLIDVNGNKLNYEEGRLLLGARPQIMSNSFGMLNASAPSNTTVKLDLNFTVDETTIGNLSNYKIYETYDDQETYAEILDAKIGSDSKTIILKTSTLKSNTHYNITLNGLKSIYGHEVNNTPKYFMLLN